MWTLKTKTRTWTCLTATEAIELQKRLAEIGEKAKAKKQA